MGDIDALIGQIDEFLRDGAEPFNGTVQVAYAAGLRAYLQTCAAVVVSTLDSDQSHRLHYLATTFPVLADKIAKNALSVSGTTGADLGLALCALGINPFQLKPADESNTVVMDLPAWKTAAVLRIMQTVSAAAQVQMVREIAAATNPAQLTQYAARLPVESLIALARAFRQNGISGQMLKHDFSTVVPPYWNESLSTAQGRLATPFADVSANAEQTIFWAHADRPRAVGALLRGLIATLLATQHATSDVTRDALWTARAWSFHLKSSGGNSSAVDSYVFSVQTTPPAPPTASDDDIRQLTEPLYDALRIAPVIIGTGGGKIDGNLRLHFSAFIGSTIDALDRDATIDKHLWLARRPSNATPEQWFSPPTTVARFSPNHQHSFVMAASVASAMHVDAHIDQRLAVNPYCRVCGTQRARARTLTCDHHAHVAVKL